MTGSAQQKQFKQRHTSLLISFWQARKNFVSPGEVFLPIIPPAWKKCPRRRAVSTTSCLQMNLIPKCERYPIPDQKAIKLEYLVAE